MQRAVYDNPCALSFHIAAHPLKPQATAAEIVAAGGQERSGRDVPAGDTDKERVDAFIRSTCPASRFSNPIDIEDIDSSVLGAIYRVHADEKLPLKRGWVFREPLHDVVAELRIRIAAARGVAARGVLVSVDGYREWVTGFKIEVRHAYDPLRRTVEIRIALRC